MCSEQYFLFRKFICSVTKSCQTLCPMDCSLPGSSVHGISQAGILERVAISFSRGSSWTRDWTCISCTARQILYHWASREAHLGSAMCLILLFTITRQALGFVLCLFPHEATNVWLDYAWVSKSPQGKSELDLLSYAVLSW